MNEEIKEILKDNDELLVVYNDNSTRTFDELTIDVLDYITNLQQKVDLYENPDDMTLFYMWLDEKSKDKMKQLQQENERLKNFITNLILELNYWELNGTKKLDIVSDYIKQEYENMLKGSHENV